MSQSKSYIEHTKKTITHSIYTLQEYFLPIHLPFAIDKRLKTFMINYILENNINNNAAYTCKCMCLYT